MAALRATSRWAVSGTPIQNSLLDFHGLFKFLHFAPYDDPKAFDDDISSIWRTKTVEEASETFKKLLSCLMIRRTKTILDLPKRDDHLMRVPFNHEEERYYRQIEQPVMEMLDRDTRDDSQTQVPWMTAIQQINKLRLICNLGVSTHSQADCNSQPGGESDDKTSVMNTRFSMDGGSCELCSQPVELSTLGSSLRNIAQPQVYYSACSKFYCADLDLTAASTAHLLEPQWNPSLEDQALARVHRLGQLHTVTTIRYVMEDSFEEVLMPQ
ncbi:uncharacterized protein J4E87_000869 [Alternaria ethzedia]|uniref:uncharacterized protein n=1 Tax=Alternaria ethzedia TaxID=181014 RepID=UPI0020C2DB72|nr:uncharacterized protein J4E87_000869 [Alternaria ethzedia]KAI4633705.1 hypothetical protein J4E87_000869 [Alternaria ethzedia]